MEQLKSPELQEALKKLQESMKQLTPEQMKQAMDQVNREAYIMPISEQPNLFIHAKDVEIKPGLTSKTETRPGDYFWK